MPRHHPLHARKHDVTTVTDPASPQTDTVPSAVIPVRVRGCSSVLVIPACDRPFGRQAFKNYSRPPSLERNQLHTAGESTKL